MTTMAISWKTVKQMQLVSAGIYPLEDIIAALTYSLGELAYDDEGIRHTDFKAEHQRNEIRWTVTFS